jgi:hypothetical protein
MSRVDGEEETLKEIVERMTQYAQPVNVPIGELLPDAFIRRHTDLPDAAAFLAAAGIAPNGGIPQLDTERFAEAVRAHSAFVGPRPFLQAATASYLRRKLGFE